MTDNTPGRLVRRTMTEEYEQPESSSNGSSSTEMEFMGIHIFWWILLIAILCATGSELKIGLGTGGSDSGSQIININND